MGKGGSEGLEVADGTRAGVVGSCAGGGGIRAGSGRKSNAPGPCWGRARVGRDWFGRGGARGLKGGSGARGKVGGGPGANEHLGEGLAVLEEDLTPVGDGVDEDGLVAFIEDGEDLVVAAVGGHEDVAGLFGDHLGHGGAVEQAGTLDEGQGGEHAGGDPEPAGVAGGMGDGGVVDGLRGGGRVFVVVGVEHGCFL